MYKNVISFALLATLPLLYAASSAEKTSAHRGNLKSTFNDNRRNSTSKRARKMKTKEELDEERKARSERTKERRRKANEKIFNTKPDLSKAEKMSMDELERARADALKSDPDLKRPQNQWLRRAGWFWGGGSNVADEDGRAYDLSDVFADPSQEYDWWAQGYRMLGGYISCDDLKEGSHDSGDNDGEACSRWMVWAAYVNPNYGGGGREEYFDDYEEGEGEGEGDRRRKVKKRKLECDEYYEDCYEYYAVKKVYENDDEGDDDFVAGESKLDCHAPNTEWKLLGVYRQELYQFYEQISKHLWGYKDYEYVVALAGLAYMTDDDCYQVGYDDDGNYIYAGPMPLPGAELMIGLYTDASCTIEDESGATFDDFGLTNDISLGSGDYYGYYGYDALEYWSDSQEYSFTNFNAVYDEYKYCTPCMDYPTYQDGYFIGDDGTDEDDLINQCWKFHSHDSYTCDNACLALADAQGTIVQIKVGDTYFGQSWYGSTAEGQDTTYNHKTKVRTTKDMTKHKRRQSIKANFFIVFSSVLFVATYLAFSVSRTGPSSSKDSKSESLLSNEDVSDLPRLKIVAKKSPRSSSRHKSRSRDEGDKSTSLSDAYSPKKSSSSRGISGYKKAYSSKRRSKEQDIDDF